MLSLTALQRLPTQKHLWLGPVGYWKASTQHDSSKDDPGLGRLIPIETLWQPTLELAGVIGKESSPTHGDVLK